MGIDRSLDGADLRQSGELWIERLPQPRAGLVARSARIGVEYAGAWAARPLRFYLRHSPWTSRPRARL
jgi:DNA-3-methyladenine glycosylase